MGWTVIFFLVVFVFFFLYLCTVAIWYTLQRETSRQDKTEWVEKMGWVDKREIKRRFGVCQALLPV